MAATQSVVTGSIGNQVLPVGSSGQPRLSISPSCRGRENKAQPARGQPITGHSQYAK